MKFIFSVLLGCCALGSPLRAELAHLNDLAEIVPGEISGHVDSELAKFQAETGINVLVRFHATSPTEAEDNAPGVYMRTLSAKLGVLEKGVLIVYFADVDEWRVWIGNELAAEFAGEPGTAAELTKSGAMHEAKEGWLNDVIGTFEHEWKRGQKMSHDAPSPSTRVGFQADGIVASLMEIFLDARDTRVGLPLDLAFMSKEADPTASPAILKGPLETRDENGCTLLMQATHRNDVELARQLIADGSDVNARDALQDTPFLYAGAEGRLEILKLTLAHGADLASVNRFGGTALIPAAEKGHLGNVIELLKTDIDINHVNNLGWTALYEAVMRPRQGSETYRAIVQALLDAGADETIADKQGRTPAQRAHEIGNDDLAGLISAARIPKVTP
ncbi:MAG: ankyrin repeat domain-containing protein [Cephaloticoccus sp.]|nr:ankyrin repeat domain-containing protein [Cephaloticoccus sp.]MCF7759262.1 ankyrin repeat domain-containing protein [Cephaloticoccus sp.]